MILDNAEVIYQMQRSWNHFYNLGEFDILKIDEIKNIIDTVSKDVHRDLILEEFTDEQKKTMHVPMCATTVGGMHDWRIRYNPEYDQTPFMVYHEIGHAIHNPDVAMGWFRTGTNNIDVFRVNAEYFANLWAIRYLSNQKLWKPLKQLLYFLMFERRDEFPLHRIAQNRLLHNPEIKKIMKECSVIYGNFFSHDWMSKKLFAIKRLA